MLVESLPSIVTMLLTGGDLDLGPFGDIADELFELIYNICELVCV